MQSASLRDDEAQSLAALQALHVLDSAPEAEFDALAQAASLVCGTPIALISLVDAERQWFKANLGLPGVTETHRDLAFCSHAVLADELLEVADAALDERFSDNPLVTGAPGIRFYAGMPLRMDDGSHVGTLCVIDRQPRALTPGQREILRHLATAAVRALQTRAAARDVASSERHFRALSESSPLGVFATDAVGACTYTNDRWQRIFGQSRIQALGDGWARTIHPDDRAAVFAEWQRTSAQRLDFDMEFRTRHDDGSVHQVRSVASPVIGPDGTVVGHVGSVEDVDAQFQAKREQAAMLDNDLVGIVKLHGHTVVWSNRGLERIFGYGRDELLNQPSRVLYADEDSHAALEAAAYPVLQAGGEYREQLQMRRKDGALIWVDMSGLLMADGPDESLWVLADITLIKQAELLRHRAVELHAENRQLQEAHRLKSQFLANMSHELRTPLNAVIGLASLLQTGAVKPDTPKFNTCLAQIGTSGRQLLGLIDSVLDFGQAQAGKIEFKPEQVRLSALLDEVLALHAEAAAFKQIDVVTQVQASLSDLTIDPMRLKQVLSCYLSNAIKFMTGAGQVTIRASAEGGDQVRIEVQDQGIGIAPEDQPKLFQQFHQLSSGNTKAYPGTGMGLALARKMVQAQGGSVGVQSTPGVGSVFFLVLPCRRAQERRQ